jgi:hypothetical protein
MSIIGKGRNITVIQPRIADNRIEGIGTILGDIPGCPGISFRETNFSSQAPTRIVSIERETGSAVFLRNSISAKVPASATALVFG